MAVQSANTNLEGRTIVEIELKLPNKVIPFSKVNITHVKSTITENIKQPSSHEMFVRAPSTDYVDNLIRYAQSKGTPKLRYRIGVGMPGQTAFLPWQDQILTDFSAAIEGVGVTAGHFVRLELSDYLFTMSRPTKVVARRGKISDIVKKIAQENGISNMVVEDTVGEGMWIQSFLDDVDFVRSRLVPRAVNAKGRGNFNFYVQDNVLHFHSPDYQAALKELVYYQTNNVALTQIDESQHGLETGASGVRLIVYDPYSAQMKEVAADPTKVLKLGNVMHQLSRVQGSDLNLPFHLSTNAPQEAENMAQTIYENARSQILGIKVDIARSVFLRVGDILRIVISPSSKRNTVWSGTYLVTDSCLVLEGGTLFSSFMVKRGEFQTADLAPTSVQVLGDNVVISEVEAPGQALNLKSTQSSGLTHGAGQSVFTSVFATTQSRNTAPNPTPNY